MKRFLVLVTIIFSALLMTGCNVPPSEGVYASPAMSGPQGSPYVNGPTSLPPGQNVPLE